MDSASTMYGGPAPLASAVAFTGGAAGRRVGLLNDRYLMCEELGRGAYGQVRLQRYAHAMFAYV